MKKIAYLLVYQVLIISAALAQSQEPDSARRAFLAAQAIVQKQSADDHRQMMEQLHITSLRSGPSGNPSAPNYANVDESKATPYWP